MQALGGAWSRDTSATPDEWTPDNSARGQCAVTALIVQDRFGGVLVRGIVNSESHYWNRVGNLELDLTAGQFGADPFSRERVVIRDRDYVLSFPATKQRYEILTARLQQWDCE